MPAAAAEGLAGEHGLSLFGDLKYGPDFTHFDYADPAAPKGGIIAFPAEGTFDSLNPFILKGVPAQGLNSLYDTLLERALDEADAAYGLIAERVRLSSDRRRVTFYLRNEARFHDGTPITAEDVVESFARLKTEGHPTYRILFADVAEAKADDAHSVTFVLGDTTNRKLPLILGTELPILPKAYFADHAFDAATLEAIPGSGPYRIERVDAGRTIVFARVPEYWAKDLPVKRGRHNFDTIRYEYFRDRTIMVEALKAREYDLHEEFTAKTWATAYDIPEIGDGRMIKEVLPDHTPSGVQAFFINTRREKFRDPRVRLALNYAFDFEWTNANLFFGLYERMGSYFENSELAAHEPPGAAELALLEPFRARLAEAVFADIYRPPRCDRAGALRANLREAARLLEEAGWVMREGQRVNEETGETLSVEFLYDLRTFERVFAPYARNLERLGIEAHLRFVDVPQYQRRLEEFDFDLTTQRYVQFLSPGVELRSYFGSPFADQPGSFNLAGIKDPVVDALIEAVLGAEDRGSLVAAARALDRVLLWGHYIVPQWFKPTHHLVYWNKFGRPARAPTYDLGLDTWWVDPAKEAALISHEKALD
jgi:microcin C transport system substrate-binding protein